jgi:hypothetical protein
MDERDLFLLEVLNHPAVVKAGKSYLKLRVEGWGGSGVVKITVKDVIDYFNTWWGYSTVRSLGPITGDWRSIRDIASFCLSYFQVVNQKALPKSLRRGL